MLLLNYLFTFSYVAMPSSVILLPIFVTIWHFILISILQYFYYTNFTMVILSPLRAHYVFCYEVLARYADKMDTYANFKTVVVNKCGQQK